MENKLLEDSQERRWWLTAACGLTIAVTVLYALSFDGGFSPRVVAGAGLLIYLYATDFYKLRAIKSRFAVGSGIIILANVYMIVLVLAALALVSYLVWPLLH